MNKMEYQKPWAEFIQFENEDIITKSNCQGSRIGFSFCTNGQGGNGCGMTGGGGCTNGNGSGGCDIWGSWGKSKNALSLDDDPGQYGEEGETFVKDEDYVNADIDGWK